MIHRYYAGKVERREFQMDHHSNCLKLGYVIRIVPVARGKLFQREIHFLAIGVQKKNLKEIKIIRKHSIVQNRFIL
jgi:hypothetical protein